MQIRELYNKAKVLWSKETSPVESIAPLEKTKNEISTVAKGGAIGTTLDDIFFFQTLRQALGDFNGVLDPYLENPWVYSSITKIAENLAHTPRRLVRVVDDDTRTVITKHPLLDLFKEPNQYLTGNQLILGTFVYLEAMGEAFWVMRRSNPTQTPESIFLLDPRRFTPVYNHERTMIIGWSYKTHLGQREAFALWEVVQFKLFNPNNPVRGIPRWVSARSGIDQDFWVSRFNSKFFKDDNLLSGIINYKGNLSDAQYKRLWTQLNAPEQTGDTASRIIILEGEQEKSFDAVDLQFNDRASTAIKKLSRAEVFAVYQTNEVVLGIYDNVKSNEGQKDARKAWWQECLIPKINYAEDIIYTQFIKFLSGGDNLRLEWDLSKVDALQEDYGDKLDHAERLQRMGYTLNQVNEKLELGFDSVEWGDVAFVPRGLVAISGDSEYVERINAQRAMALAARNPQQAQQEQTQESESNQESGEKLLRALDVVKSEDEYIRPTYAKKHYVVKGVLSQQEAFESKFMSKFKRWLMEVRSETINNLRHLKAKDVRKMSIADLLFDEADAIARYSKIMLPAYVEAIKNGIFSVDVELNIVSGANDFAVSPSMEVALNKYLLARIDDMSPKIVGTIADKLTDTLSEGLRANETVAQLTTRIRETLNETATRALRIARTESGAVINGGRYLEMQNRRVAYSEWVSAGDTAVRDSHANVDGEVRPFGETFSNGLRFPNDPLGEPAEVINCRCVAVVVEKRT